MSRMPQGVHELLKYVRHIRPASFFSSGGELPLLQKNERRELPWSRSGHFFFFGYLLESAHVSFY